MLTDLVYETIGWRILYICWGVATIPVVFMAWRFIKPTKPTEKVSSVRKLLSMLGWLLKQPLVWMCGISFGLTMACVGNFGFVWDLNLQDALGWRTADATLLSFMFVAGVIAGGYFVTLLSKWIGEYPSILISMSVGVIVFFISVYVTSSLRDIWISSPMLLLRRALPRGRHDDPAAHLTVLRKAHVGDVLRRDERDVPCLHRVHHRRTGMVTSQGHGLVGRRHAACALPLRDHDRDRYLDLRVDQIFYQVEFHEGRSCVNPVLVRFSATNVLNAYEFVVSYVPEFIGKYRMQSADVPGRLR